MQKRLAASLALCLATMPALAHATVYDCTMKDSRSSQGWIMDRIVVNHDATAGTVEVLDAMIQSEKGKPIAGKIASDTSAKLTVSWILPLKDTHGQQIKMLYRANITKADGAVSVHAVPQGYSNSFNAKGKCTKK